MQKIFIAISSFFILFSTASCAQGKKKGDNAVANTALSTTAKSASKEHTSIEWKTFEEVEQLMKVQPKRVLIDVYTDWCGWCKKMDKDIYENKDAVKYINEHFYAIKFNAEQKEDIVFMGQTYKAVATGRSQTNQLAIEMMQGQLSYPTTVFMDLNFTNPVVQPGYLKLNEMESVLKYVGSGAMTNKTPFDEFSKSEKMTWK